MLLPMLFTLFSSLLRLLLSGVPRYMGQAGKKRNRLFVDCALVGGNCSMNFFTKSLLLEMLQENLIRRLQGFVILPVSGAKPLHCGNEYIVIAALTLELL